MNDPLDRSIIRALQLAPRIPFSVVAEVLTVSEQTVARRYQRLRRDGLLRVTALVSPEALGESNWTVRVRCRPSGATSLAQALAQRDDVSWVSVLAGGTEILCTVRSRTAAAREDLLLQRLPRTTQVLGMSALMMLHRFGGSGSDDWSGLADALTAEQQRHLLAAADSLPPLDPAAAPVVLDMVNAAILDALVADGRTSVARLAAVAGTSEGRAARRLRSLLEGRVALLDVDSPPEALGFAVNAYLWMTVAPAHLDAAGREIARYPEIAFAAAVTGTQNLLAAALCRDTASLYRLVSDRMGKVAGVATLEVSPVLRTVKQAGSLLSDGRLAPQATT